MAPKPVTEADLTLDHYLRGQFHEIRATLLDLYREIYVAQLSEPFFTEEKFAERLKGHASAPGWECVVGSVDGIAIGYAYGFPFRKGGGWSGLRTPVDPALTEETGNRTFALCEIMVREHWRKTGAAYTIHEELLRQRTEKRTQLLVEQAHPRLRALYERWGYHWVAERQPFSEGPVYDSLVRVLEQK